MQVEVSKVRAEKAILNDRLAYERDRFEADVSALQKQLEAAQSHDKLDTLEHERDMSRELVVLAQGEIMTLEKRLAAQVRLCVTATYELSLTLCSDRMSA